MDETTEAVLPPFEPLAALVAGLSAHGIPVVLGGSGLLHALGLVTTVNDWDLVTDSPAEQIAATLIELGVPAERAPEHPGFASDALFRLEGGIGPDGGPGPGIDLMVRFRVRTPDGIEEIPAAQGGRWRGIPLARAQDWLRAYRALGRGDKAALLSRHLEESAG